MHFLFGLVFYFFSVLVYSQELLVLTEYVEGTGYNKALEITNYGQIPLDLNKVKIQIFNNGRTQKQGPSQSIALSGTLEPQKSYVVVHPRADAKLLRKASQRANLSFNGNDALVVRYQNEITDVFGQVGISPGDSWESGALSSKNQTLRRFNTLVNGNTNPQAPFDLAQEWISVGLDQWGGLGCSGEQNCTDSRQPSACPQENRVDIVSIQGEGDRSPLVPAGSDISEITYTTQGVVTKVLSDLTSGFFIQDLESTFGASSGLFVYTGQNISQPVQEGDSVCVTGKIKEYRGLTEIAAVSIVNQGPAPEKPSALMIDISDNIPLSQQLEPYEGMLVELPPQFSITRTFSYDYRNRRDNLVLAHEVPLIIPTQAHNALTQEAQMLRESNLIKQIVVETDPFARKGQVPWFPEFNPITGYLRVGDKLSGLQGVLSQYGRWQLIATNQIDTLNVIREPRPTVLDLPRAAGLKVAAFNVYNFFTSPFTGVNNPTNSNRGARSIVEFELQTNKLVAALLALDADIIGLMELENNGFDEGSSIQTLVTALNQAQNAPEKHYQVLEVEGRDFVGDDAITNGIIYRPSVVSTSGKAQVFSLPRQAITVDGKTFNKTQRPALIQTFKLPAQDKKLTLAVNHFKSKGSACYEDYPDELSGATLDGQGRCNELRVSAALALGEHLSTINHDVLIMGDLNAYAQEDPILVLTDALEKTKGRPVMTSAHTYKDDVLLYRKPKKITSGYDFFDVFVDDVRASTYSYEGEQGRLDYILASKSLAPYIAAKTVWKINATESPLFGYSSRFSGDLEKSEDMYRSSDHDPVLVVINYDQKEEYPIAFSTQQITVHPDAQTVQVRLERIEPNLKDTLEIVIASQDATWQQTLKWPAQDRSVKTLLIPTPSQSTMLQVVAINGQATINPPQIRVTLDPALKSFITMKERMMIFDEQYMQVKIPVTRTGDLSRPASAAMKLSSDQGRLFINYMPWFGGRVTWDAWDNEVKYFTFYLLRDWFGTFDFKIDATLYQTEQAQVTNQRHTYIYIQNTDSPWWRVSERNDSTTLSGFSSK